MRTRSAAVALAAIVVAGGLLFGYLSHRATSPDRSRVIAGKTCAEEVPTPVPVDVVVKALRAHRVTAHRDTYCTAPDAAAQVSNLSLSATAAQQRGVQRGEGDVLCLLTRERGPRKLVRLRFGKEGVSFALLNVRCEVYPLGGHADLQTRRVAAALIDIEHRYT